MSTVEMLDVNQLSDEEYQEYILQGVSRTFALTIPQLPNKLKSIVGNAYLLCRIADTIEDDAALTIDQKRAFSREFIEIVQGVKASVEFSRRLNGLLSAETPSTEKDLIGNTEKVIRVTRGFTSRQQAILSTNVDVMTRGMAYFQANEPNYGLASLNEFNSYCYHVAGVVGEMLTELYCDYSEVIARNKEELMGLSLSFGQGLQMTNILKDIWDDGERGICWLPQDVFKRHGVDLHEWEKVHASTEFANALGDMIAIAHGHLRKALDYTLLIPAEEKGLRKFCTWAIGMALLTLQKIHHNRAFSRGSEVKISRRRVKATILLCNVSVSNDALTSSLFNLAAIGLPKPIDTELSLTELSLNKEFKSE